MQHLNADTILASAVEVKERIDTVIINDLENGIIRTYGVGVDEPEDAPEPDEDMWEED